MLLISLIALFAAMPADMRPKPIEPGSWIDTSDYPPDALIRGATGMVAFWLRVDEAGIPVSCAVTTSSGDASLDTATCAQIQAHARFEAAVGAGGKPVASVYTGRVKWQLPSEPPPTNPGLRLPMAPPQPWPGTASQQRWTSTRTWAGGVKLPSSTPALQPPSSPAPTCATLTAAASGAADRPPADPRLRKGQLPNGLRYLILCNAAEPESVSLRLRIAGGSISEGDNERGYTHLLEHMAFRGSENVPDGRFERSLEAMGLRLGDGNTANTTPEDTIYSLDYPPGTPSAIDNGLSMLREIAGRALIAPEALSAERGVVLSEERVRDTPDQRVDDARLAFLLEGQRAATRPPIGTRASITGATADALRDFYRSRYRPEAATLVVVGAFDPADIERRISQQFADWTPQRPAPPPVDPGRMSVRGERTRLIVTPGASDRLELYWVAPFDSSPDTIAHQLRGLASHVAIMVLNERLARAIDTVGSSLASAAAWSTSMLHSADVTALSVTPVARNDTGALAAAMREEQRLVTFGVTPAEKERALARIRTLLSDAANQAPAITSPYLAGALVQSAADGTVFSSPGQRLEVFDRLAAALSAADIKTRAGEMFSGSGPLLFASRSVAPLQAEAGLRAALGAATRQSVTNDAVAAAMTWPYTRFGGPGRAVAREEVLDLGVTIVRFANGSSLTYKPSSSISDGISVDLTFGAGLSGLPEGLGRAYWLLNTSTFLDGGLGKATASEVGEHFSGKSVSVSFGTSEDRFHLTGSTRPQDLDSELQLLTAYVADPGFRPEALRRTQIAARSSMAQFNASSLLRSGRDLAFVLHDRDPRWAGSPSIADLDGVRPGDLEALLRPSLAGPVDLIIVGNLPIDRAIAAAASTIGALPTRGSRPAPRPARFPATAAPFAVELAQGRADQAVAVAAWPTPGFYSFASTRDARGVQLLAKIVEGRLISGLRETDGLTYAPAVFADQSLVFSNYGVIAAQVEIQPEKVDRFYSALAAIMADLAKNPVSRDELDRARNPLYERSRSDMLSTGYWLSALVGASDDRRRLDVIRSRLEDLALASAADVQRLARTYVRAAATLRFTVSSRPERAPQPHR